MSNWSRGLGYWGWSEEETIMNFHSGPPKPNSSSSSSSSSPPSSPSSSPKLEKEQVEEFIKIGQLPPVPLYLKTGDQGFIHNDRVYLVGRIKSVIIVKGFFYPLFFLFLFLSSSCAYFLPSPITKTTTTTGHNIEPTDIEPKIWDCSPSLRTGRSLLLPIPNDETGTEDLVVIAEVGFFFLIILCCCFCCCFCCCCSYYSDFLNHFLSFYFLLFTFYFFLISFPPSSPSPLRFKKEKHSKREKDKSWEKKS